MRLSCSLTLPHPSSSPPCGQSNLSRKVSHQVIAVLKAIRITRSISFRIYLPVANPFPSFRCTLAHIDLTFTLLIGILWVITLPPFEQDPPLIVIDIELSQMILYSFEASLLGTAHSSNLGLFLSKITQNWLEKWYNIVFDWWSKQEKCPESSCSNVLNRQEV